VAVRRRKDLGRRREKGRVESNNRKREEGGWLKLTRRGHYYCRSVNYSIFN